MNQSDIRLGSYTTLYIDRDDKMFFLSLQILIRFTELRQKEENPAKEGQIQTLAGFLHIIEHYCNFCVLFIRKPFPQIAS